MGGKGGQCVCTRACNLLIGEGMRWAGRDFYSDRIDLFGLRGCLILFAVARVFSLTLG